MLFKWFEDMSKAAVWFGLHFKIISFTDMHEWTSTKYCIYVCVCVRVGICVQGFVGVCVCEYPASSVLTCPQVFNCAFVPLPAFFLCFLEDPHILNSCCIKHLAARVPDAVSMLNRCREVKQTNYDS